MSEKSFNFKCYKFQDNIALSFQDLLKENNFADVTLVTDDQTQIQAHKIILSVFCPVLKNIVLNNPNSLYFTLYFVPTTTYDLTGI